MTKKSSSKDTQSRRIIAKFGGIAPMARVLNHTNPSTVQGWWERGTIPAKRHQEVFDAAKREGIKLLLSDFQTVSTRAA